MPSECKQIVLAAISFISLEVIAAIVFYFVRKKYAKSKVKNISILKGILERLVVYIGLLLNFQSIIIVYGTLKIATRIKTDPDDEKISNDYFLIGNFLSLFIVFCSILLFKYLSY